MFLTHNCIIMMLYITVQNRFLFSGLTQGSTAATIHMDERRRWGLGWAGGWWPLMVKSWQALHEIALWMNLMKLKVRISKLNWAYTGKIPRGLSRQESEFPSILMFSLLSNCSMRECLNRVCIKYPTMHYCGIPKHAQSKIAYSFSQMLHFGNVFNIATRANPSQSTFSDSWQNQMWWGFSKSGSSV